jgi:XamI restriction endonuclease
MSAVPPRWTHEELTSDAEQSARLFREQRLGMAHTWNEHYARAADKFERLLAKLDAAKGSATSSDQVADIFGSGLGEAFRYLAGPPISDDDLRVIADIDSLSPRRLRAGPQALARVGDVVLRILDPHRFPWIAAGREPTPVERHAAVLASAVLLAAQRECMLGERKADVVVRLQDTRLLAIECKVSNSALNSVKRLNNDAAVKADSWLEQFGSAQVVPSAVVSGVFKVLNLEQAQRRGLAVFWAHDLSRLGAFIESTH